MKCWEATTTLFTVSLCIQVKAVLLCVYNALTGLSRYARLVPCTINTGSCVMCRAWWSVSTDAMVWSNLPARPPRVTMASTWKETQSLISNRENIPVCFPGRILLKWRGKTLFHLMVKWFSWLLKEKWKKQQQFVLFFSPCMHLYSNITHCLMEAIILGTWMLILLLYKWMDCTKHEVSPTHDYLVMAIWI